MARGYRLDTLPHSVRNLWLAVASARGRAGSRRGRRFRSTGLTAGRWKDYAAGNRIKTMALSAGEFLSRSLDGARDRFLLHVLPGGFVRIRHFGLLANRGRAAKLARCRELLAAAAPEAPATPEPFG